MQTARILTMNTEEPGQNERDERHAGSQRDIKSIKVQIDKLTGEVGKLVVALKGDDLGTEGVLPRIVGIEKEVQALKARLDEMELLAKKNQMYLIAFVTTVGVVLGTLIKSAIDHLFKK